MIEVPSFRSQVTVAARTVALPSPTPTPKKREMMLVKISVIPLFFFYISHICLGSMSFVVMSSRYIQVRQRALLAKFRSLNRILEARKMRMEMGGSKSCDHISLQPIWHRYYDLNAELVEICLHIKAYARFWSSFLTLMFPYLIFVQCYLLYLAVIAEGIAFELTYIYKLGIAELMPLFFMLIGQCAKVVAINNRVLVENRRFFVAYSQLTLRGGGGDNHGRGYQQFRAQRLMKAENFQIVRALHTYSFKVFTSYRITSKTFHSIIVYISIFFLYVYKE
ncbi:hypothetical protein TYRP_020328 [Tyrophagus putrescentiae]|nr:hypothetical protein TYRP_020328 [Tyrophagus putrescentiae]